MKLQDIALTLEFRKIYSILLIRTKAEITPDKEYNLKVPIGTAEKFTKIVEEIPKYEKTSPVFIHYKTKRGKPSFQSPGNIELQSVDHGE